MKSVIVALLLTTVPVVAETLSINIEYTLPSGFSSSWIESGNGGCAAAKKLGPYGGCIQIPLGKQVRQCTGTQTIKIPNVELLNRIICGGMQGMYVYETIWMGHHLSTLYNSANQAGLNTIHVSTPMLPADLLLAGPNACWNEYQAINSSPDSPNGGGFEVQVTCSVY